MSLPGAARALGLGEIRVDSALNEPLSAQIDIVGATRDELIALTAKVANRDIFQRLGAERPSFLASATFKVGLDAQGRPVLNVRSAEAFTDPVIDFVVDLRWGNAELVREYSLLLDPPVFNPVGPRALAAIVSDSALPAPAPMRAPGRLAEPGSALHRVAAGDTLRGIVGRSGARTESQAQRWMIAVFRANPHAFDGNINRLHLGALLSIPSSETVAAIDGADAKREVRAQMTAWRLDGRPNASRRAAAAPAPSVAKAAAAQPLSEHAAVDDALKGRVQSLEQSLEDMHRELASENEKIQALKQLTAPAVHSDAVAHSDASAAAHSDAVAHRDAPAHNDALAHNDAPATGATTSLTQVHESPLPVRNLASVAPTPEAMNGKGLIGPIALTLGVFLAGFAYVRKRLSPTAAHPHETAIPEYQRSDPTADLPSDSAREAALPVRVSGAAAPIPPAELKRQPLTPAAPRVEQTFAQPADPIPQTPAKPTSDQTTISLEIDADALERSYLDTMNLDADAFQAGIADAVVSDAAAHDTAAHDMSAYERGVHETGLETVVADMTDFDTRSSMADVNTLILDPKKRDVAALDYNLADIDGTEKHVQMPSNLNEVVMRERRTNIVDVLKGAIDRDPQRRDLRMKLMETYYSLAALNQQAFLEVVRKLANEPELLKPEDWQRVMTMGREIAPSDVLFADQKRKDELANCA